MINVERAEVIKAASAARVAKMRNQGDLLRPPFGLFVEPRAVFVAEHPLALQGAIAHLARFAAVLATAAARPAMGEVARLAAIFSRAVAQSVGVHLGGLFTAGANDRRGCGSHAAIITNSSGFYKPRYFDIACRRIEAEYRQPRLFTEPAPRAVQEALL